MLTNRACVIFVVLLVHFYLISLYTHTHMTIFVSYSHSLLNLETKEKVSWNNQGKAIESYRFETDFEGICFILVISFAFCMCNATVFLSRLEAC